MSKVKLFNTLTRQKEDFEPIEKNKVKIYNCGPTVYDYVHIGNLLSFTFADTLRRSFEYLGYEVTQVMNITDVGHLVSDDDEGEDKMEKGAKRAGKTVWQVAQFYTDAFLEDSRKMNFKEPSVRPKATDHIQEMIDMIEVLIDKGYAYVTASAIYFDVTRFPDYTKLSGQKLDKNLELSREELVQDPNKRHPFDFRLWQLDQPGHSMQWDSPWGKGFPGWHLECSAMSKKYLGDTFDIHTGGFDHIPVHHTNEIAQSEAANGKKFVNYWMHNQFLLVNNEKMSKSKGNFYNLRNLEEKGFEPLALRLLFLQSKYREQLNFTLESLQSAQNSLKNLTIQVNELLAKTDLSEIKPIKGDNSYQKEFEEALADDLNTAIALSVLFKLLKDNNIEPKVKLAQILSFDEVLGLRLQDIQESRLQSVDTELIKQVEKLIQQRTEAKQNKDYEKADELRNKAKELGFELLDTPKGTTWKKM